VSSTAFEGVVTTVPAPTPAFAKLARRQGWTVGVGLLFVALLSWQIYLLPRFGDFQIRTITAGTMPLAFIAMAQAVVVISGGIDLSVGAKMALANCLAAMWMDGRGFGACLAIAVAVLVISVVVSGLTGLAVIVTGVPDIIVTLAAGFTIAGLALFVIGGPGGGTSIDFQHFVAGGLSDYRPSVLWTIGVLALAWWPLRRSRVGLAISAVGSDRRAAFLSGVAVASTRVKAYALAGFFAGFAGLATTAITGGGDPRASYANINTLNSVAAVVLGGVALTGGVGGLLGPVLAALCLTLIPGIMLGLGVDPSNAETARGVIIILVVLVAGLLQSRRRRA